jgi:HlyD family secretion protein
MNLHMNTKKKRVFTGLLLSTTLLMSACSALTGRDTAATATATRGVIDQTIEATGTIASSSEAKLSFQQSGVVRSVSVNIGDAVKKGNVLAELDTTDLELSVRQAEAQFQQSQNNIRNAQQAILIAQANYSRTVEGARETDLKAAEAALASAQANYAKTTNGQASDAAAAKAALDAAQANLDKVKAGPTNEDVAGARAALQNAEAALKQAQSAYDRAYGQNPASIGASPAALALEQATNNYALAKSNFDKVAQGADDAQLRAAEQQLASAKANYARYYGSNYTANKSAAQQQIASAQASLEKLKEPARDFDLAQVSAQIEQARIALDNAKVTATLNEIALAQAQRRLAQAVLRAPFDGVVGSVNVREGESVSVAGAPTSAFVIADTNGYHMDVTVDELDVSNLRTGQTANISVDALPGTTVSGKVERISSTGTKINGVVNYNVRVALDSANGANDALKNGMSATARIVLERKDNALLVPANAVRQDSATGKAFLTVRNNNQAQEIEVKVGLRNATSIEIVNGVAEGAIIVLK